MNRMSRSDNAALGKIQEQPDSGIRLAPDPPVGCVTLRAVLMGLLSIAFLVSFNTIAAYGAFAGVIPLWITGDGGLLSGPIQLAFVFLIANTVLLRVVPRRAFSRSEILVVYGMMIIAVAFVYGGSPGMVAFVAYPYYGATEANGWAQLVWPHIPPSLTIADPAVVRWFWEGSPPGRGVPWGVWRTPLIAVSVFYAALMGATYCLGSLVSRDWMLRQRLVFPMAEIPLAMIGDKAQPSLGSGIWRSRVFWIGFAIPATVNALNWLNGLFPNVPYIDLKGIMPGRYFAGMPLPWSVLGDLRMKLYWGVIGIACLVPTEVSLSLWLFHFVYRLQTLVWASFAMAEGSVSTGAIDPRRFVEFEEAGALIALCAVILYQSRHAFAAAWRGLVRMKAGREGDPYVALSGRWALLGFIVANAFLLVCLAALGGAWWVSAGMIVMMVLFYAYSLVSAKLISASGVMYVYYGARFRALTLATVGSAAVRPEALTAGTYVDGIFMNNMCQMEAPMSHMLGAFKVLRTSRTSAKLFTVAAAAGVVVMLAAVLPTLLLVTHRVGANAMDEWFFGGHPLGAFAQLDSVLRTPAIPDNRLRLALPLGAAIMLGLVYMHSNFLWWAISPIGFVIASSEMTNRTVWGNFLIGWLVSLVIRRTGGLRLYRAADPRSSDWCSAAS